MLDAGFKPAELIPYIYLTTDEFEASKIQVIYLGWFLGDWSLVRNASYACAVGLNIREDMPEATGDLFGISNLDEDWHNMNQMIKYLKFGFGKVTEYVNESIRNGEMTRAEAVELVERYDGKCSEKYIRSFCDYIGLKIEEFWVHVHRSTNRKLFNVSPEGVVTRKFAIGVGLST